MKNFCIFFCLLKKCRKEENFRVARMGHHTEINFTLLICPAVVPFRRDCELRKHTISFHFHGPLPQMWVDLHTSCSAYKHAAL